MNELDFLPFSYWADWQHVELPTIRDAACLLAGIDPAPYRMNNRILPSEAEAMEAALTHSILLGKLRPFALWGWDDEGQLIPLNLESIGPHLRVSSDTTLRVEELARWADARKLGHRWPVSAGPEPGTRTSTNYPDELLAAIEAFEAVHGDPNATAKVSPKAAIAAWLKLNKPELSDNARERIATVANWRPQGGAPSTPNR